MSRRIRPQIFRFRIRRLEPRNVPQMRGLLAVFGRAFNEVETYEPKRPRATYLRKLLQNESFMALAAICDEKVIGGLAAYELQKFEQERREIYIYDLAVAEQFRRRGVATALIKVLQEIAAERGAYVIYVQADRGDDAAIALYSGLGKREEVLHFDIPVNVVRRSRGRRRP